MSGTIPAGAHPLILAEETLWLLPERAVLWPARGWLLLADAHLGKGGALRRAGLAVPAGGTARTLELLGALVTRTAARRVVILGDVLHAALPPADPLPRLLAEWRERHPEVALAALRGNHDRTPGPLANLVEWHADTLEAGPFVLRHHPEPDRRRPVLAGHLHPVVHLRGSARDSARLPAFILERGVLTLPAFGELTGGHPVSPAPGRTRYVATPNRVIPVHG